MNQTSPPTSRKALPSPLCPCTVAGTTLGLLTMTQALSFWSAVSGAKKLLPSPRSGYGWKHQFHLSTLRLMFSAKGTICECSLMTLTRVLCGLQFHMLLSHHLGWESSMWNWSPHAALPSPGLGGGFREVGDHFPLT